LRRSNEALFGRTLVSAPPEGTQHGPTLLSEMLATLKNRPGAKNTPRAKDRPGANAATRRALDTEDHGPMAENEAAERFTRVLGVAALDLWSDLPQEIQQRLFERAVLAGHKTERDESLREQLAQFLHDHHERTAAR
jgi:hypothetical protein